MIKDILKASEKRHLQEIEDERYEQGLRDGILGQVPQYTEYHLHTYEQYVCGSKPDPEVIAEMSGYINGYEAGRSIRETVYVVDPKPEL